MREKSYVKDLKSNLTRPSQLMYKNYRKKSKRSIFKLWHTAFRRIYFGQGLFAAGQLGLTHSAFQIGFRDRIYRARG